MGNVIKNTDYYVELTNDYTANVIEGGAAFWSRSPEEISENHPHLMIVQYEYTESWQTQEMHPYCDEIITLLSGEVEFVLDRDAGEERVPMHAGETLIIPKGVWHTGRVVSKAIAQHILMGRGTQIRKAGEKNQRSGCGR
jgi:mannose-6-phosphate isomerase-like protein (cupin superfamily)